MTPGNDNQVDWKAAAVSEGDRVVPGLGRKPRQQPPAARRNVMDALLGENDMVAVDVAGSDPYNNTGRFFRR
jgi:hypothetical protein